MSATGEAGLDWANVGSPTTALVLSGTTISSAQKVDVETIKTNPVVNAGTITFPATATLASTTNITAGTITTASNLTTNNDKTGYGLSAAAVQAIWDALTSALTTAGSIGKKLADWAIGSSQTGDSFARLGAPAGASVSADIAAAKADTAAIKAKTDNLPAAPASTTNITAGTITTTTNLTNLPAITANWITAAGVADGAIDRATFAADTGLQSIRSNTAQTGAVNSITLDTGASASNNVYNGSLIRITAGTGADQIRIIRSYNGTTKVADTTPDWTTTPDATSAFAILPIGPADVVTVNRSPQTGADVGLAVGTDIPATLLTIRSYIDTEVAAIKAKTDNLPAAPASTTNITAGTMTTTTNLTTNNDKTGYALTSGERDSTADAHLARNIAGGSSTGRTVKQALASIRNKVAFDVPTAGSFSVYDVDDITVLYTGTYTAGTASTYPVTVMDPTT